MQILCALLFLISGSPFLPHGSLASEQEYIQTYQDLAIAEMHRSGIPASIKMAQAIVESDFGRSILARRANNHFGIKCKSYWEGQKYFYSDDERDRYGNPVESCFRYYDSVESSFRDHSVFLTTSRRYQHLFALAHGDYKGWARGLKNAGYATDPGYADKLIRVIERYALYTFDQTLPAD